jgi:UDP-N-acetylglucosamine--N-acetylmuramyl-(pentapeptide) pyrophosphoryl-undecaprenol N-acetylglucosamine transferase
MRVLLTGGGTLGHVTPNLAVIEEFIKRSRKHELLYIGAKKGVEKDAVLRFALDLDLKKFEYKAVSSGKLRRYFSFQNFVDVFKVMFGVCHAVRVIRKFNPHVVFSKGGFVSVPVVVGTAWINFWRRLFGRERIHIFVHESDVTPGLANKIGSKFADKIFVSFEKSRDGFGSSSRKGLVEVVGNPVRRGVLKGSVEDGRKLCGFHKFGNVLLVMGGSQGAKQINELVWDNLDKILKKWQVVHIVGKGNLKFGLKKQGYKQFELLYDELKDVYAIASVVVSRGGANSLAELAALGKKAVIVPLGLEASRGDQIVNAKVCGEEYGWQVLLGKVGDEQFLRAIELAGEEEFKGGDVKHGEAAKNIVDELVD